MLKLRTGRNCLQMPADPSISVNLVKVTGVGIPSEELPRMFERFHRIERSRGRTNEGTGIGLALVPELVKLHGGTIAVASVAGEGTTFTVAIPLGKAHLDFQRIAKAPALSSTVVTTAALVEEALRWLPREPAANGHAAEPDSRTSFESEEVRLDRESDGASVARNGKARVLIADDNAGMGNYLRRVLAPEHEVEVVTKRAEALTSLDRARLPDLLLTDVMMPCSARVGGGAGIHWPELDEDISVESGF